MNALFERNRTEWEIRITRGEVLRVFSLIINMGRRAEESPVVWLTKVSPTRRVWIIRDRATLAWISADASPKEPDFALPIPDHFLEEMMDLARTVDGVDVYCNEAENIIVCRGDGRYAAIDHPRDARFSEMDLPYITSSLGEPGHHAVATVAGEDISSFATSTANIPTRIEIDFYPFVQVAIGDNSLRWTMDWRRYGLWQFSRSVPATTAGEATFTFFPWVASKALMAQDLGGDVRVFVDGPEADFVYFVGDDWGVRILNDAEHLGRWSSRLQAALEALGCVVDPHETERIPDVLRFSTVDGRYCSASIHAINDGMHEVIRLMYVVAENVDERTAVLERVNDLNLELIGARLVVRDGQVRVTTDFPTTSFENIAVHLADLSRAIGVCEVVPEFVALLGD